MTYVAACHVPRRTPLLTRCQIKEKRLHVPLVDRLPDEPPPRLVAIAGPPGVGKSTLLRSLIRRYAKETISEPQGPITVVTSKKQRLTFIECPNELEGMIDIAKVADVVLLMIDGNFGFEMETFEFINVLASNGMPGHVFGILTHLDLFRKPQALKDAKKRIKHRLWSETYQGAHLFYLSGVINGRYPDREIHNLSRFLSVMKNPRPLVWRNSHPYTVVDSFLDATHPAEIEKDEKCDRTVVLSGYLRGTNFAAQGQRVHIPGLGYDLTIANMELLPDPCSTPAMDKAMEMVTGKTRRRRLDEKDKRLYAPMSDRSGLKIDGDAIYIYREKGFTFDKDADVERGEGEELMIRMQENRKLLGQTDEGMQLFRGGEAVQLAPEEHDTGRKTQRRARLANGDQESDDGGGHDDEPASELDNFDARGLEEGQFGRTARSRANKSDSGGDIVFPEADSDLGSLSSGDEEDGLEFDSEDLDDDEDDPAVRWKENMAERARSLHQRRRPYQASALARMMYDESLSIDEVLRRWKGEDDDGLDEEGTEEAEDEFFQKSRIDKLEEDRATPNFDYDKLAARWTADAVENLRHSLLKRDGAVRNASDDDEDSEGDGVFEDLETGEKHGAQSNPGPQAEPEDFEDERDKNARRKEELKLRFEEEDREGFNNPKAIARREGGDQDEFGEDEWYDAQKALMQKQLDINKAEYEALDERQRVTVEGFRAGNYAKMVIKGVPAEFVKTFNARMPLIVGGLAATEDRFGFVQVRVKRHRWFPKKVLKANDPLIFSLGWRRFQTLPIYSISDSRTRNRLLKYTPEHMHCFGTFYGPLIAPNTGFVCFQSFSAAEPGFRIAASGTVLNVDESTEIVKKLKLTGEPYKIFSNTAFIKGMFNSALEVAKFEGAAIKTVSGVRNPGLRPVSPNPLGGEAS